MRRFRQVRFLALAAAGKIMDAPDWPLQLVVTGGRKAGWQHVRRRHTIVHAHPYRHQHLAAHGAFAEDIALGGAHGNSNADMPPVIRHQLHHVGFERAFACRLDDDIGRTPIRQEPEASAVAPVETGFIEQPVGGCAVEGAPGVRKFLPVKRAFRQNGIGALLRQPVKTDHVDFVPVDRKGQSTAHAYVLKSAAPDRIGAIQVGQKRDA
ncbi:hypothetical protein D3C78_1102180 [compost metagenome]